MLNTFAERPFLLSFLLFAIASACAWGWIQTGKRIGLILGGIFLLLIPVGIYVERIWVTDRESLVDSIQQIASALEANDLKAVFRFIDPDADQATKSANAELPRYYFREVRINETGFRDFDIRTDFAEAIVDFIVNVRGTLRQGGRADMQGSRRLIVRFRKSDNIWRVVEYTHLPVIGPPDGYSPRGGKPPAF